MFSKRGFSIRKNKSVLVIIFIVFFIILFSVLIALSMTPFRKEEFVPNINALYTKQPSEGRNIFFLETSGIFNLNARQACAVESAALMNPELKIFLFFLSDYGFPNATTTPIIDAIMEYQNVQINYLNMTQYAKGTPMEEWVTNGELARSKYRVSHTSDVLRFLTLWKYGGTYLDLDVVVLKTLESIAPNYAGEESVDFVGSALINLEQQGIGHVIADMCVKELIVNFDGVAWANNGPDLFTRILRKQCQTQIIKEMSAEKCNGFRVLPVSSCYEVNYNNYTMLFNETISDVVMESLQPSIITHMWNKISESTKLLINSNAVYIRLAKKHCPKVFATCHKYF